MLDIAVLVIALLAIIVGIRGTYTGVWNGLFPGYPISIPQPASSSSPGVQLDPNAQVPGQQQIDANGTPYISGGSVYPITPAQNYNPPAGQPTGSTDMGTYYQSGGTSNQYPAGAPGSTVPPGVDLPPLQAVGSGTYVPGYGMIPVTSANNPNLDAGYFVPTNGPIQIIPAPGAGGVYPIANG